MIAALAAVCYVPLLLTAPGRVASDTKSYLYLDPGRLLARAPFMWDSHVGMGTVTHQNIGYLFPMGPWFWLFEAVGAPDWVAQRLWLGTVLFAAGAGVWFLLRDACLPAPAVAVASFAYALTPYTLTHAGKHSVVLLPFSGLPWLLAFTQRSVRRGGWSAPAAFALVVLAVGGVNATALVLVGLAPLLWLLFAWLTGESGVRRILASAARIGVLTTVVSVWWMAGLWAQGAYGLDILRFTETPETVADASVSVEVLRSLGYWFFYGRDRLTPWVSASIVYVQRLWVIAASFAVPILAVAAAAITRWRERAYYVALLAIGVFASVGAHPWDDPPLGGQLWKVLLQTDAGLALRSTPRAVPLVALALAVLLGSGVAAVGRALAAPRTWLVAGALIVVVAVAMPPLFTGGMIDETLQRDEDIPRYWHEATAALDADGVAATQAGQTRVLALPGIDFAAYRWGTTVDPIAPGLMDRPFVAREVVPYGSPASADLLNALDRRIQENVLDPDALAPIARLMGVGSILSRNDIEYERYRAARPYEVRALLDAAPDVGPPQTFGAPVTVTESSTAPLLDELFLAQPAGALTVAPVAIRPVVDPVPIIRAKPSGRPVIVAGDGEGLVSAASAGLIDGTELVRYSASLSDEERADLPAGARLVLTDTNRRRGRRWYTVRENAGYTEAVGVEPLVDDLSDNRLQLFGTDPTGVTQSVAEYRGGVIAQATSYGNPTTLTPEYRPANAVDGDPSTVWRTGAGRDVRGERIVLSFDDTVMTDHIVVRQLAAGAANRSIAAVELTFDDDDGGGDGLRFGLGPASQGDGERLEFPRRSFRSLSIEIVADSDGRSSRPFRPMRWFGLDSVGFAEIDVDGRRGDEHVRLPLDLPTGADRPLTILLERLRSDPAERVRQDEEPSMRRIWTLGRPRSFSMHGGARLSAAAPDDLIDRLVDPDRRVIVRSSRRLEGDLRRRASAAADGSLDTAWMPPFGAAEDWIEIDAGRAVTIEAIAPVVVDAGRHSLPRQIHITGGGAAATIDLPQAPTGADGLVRHQPIPLPTPLTGSTFRFTFTDVEERTTTEWFSGAPIRVPIAVAELGVPALTEAAPPPTRALDDRCREDLVSVDGKAVAVKILATVADALHRRLLRLEACARDIGLSAGEHRLVSSPGSHTGFDVDRLALSDVSGAPAAGESVPPVPSVRADRQTATSVELTITGADPRHPFWLVLGQSANEGWAIEIDDAARAGPRQLVDGFANGWEVIPRTAEPFTIRLEWRPQRVVWAALAVSVAGVVGCLALVAIGWRRRDRRRVPSADAAAADSPGPRLAEVGARSAVPWGWAAAAALAVAAGTDIAVGPVPAALAGVAAFASARQRWALAITRLAAPAALAVAAGYVLARQLLAEPEPALEWPAELSAMHQVAWTSVALLVAVTVADRLRRRFPIAAEGMTVPVAASSHAAPNSAKPPSQHKAEPD